MPVVICEGCNGSIRYAKEKEHGCACGCVYYCSEVCRVTHRAKKVEEGGHTRGVCAFLTKLLLRLEVSRRNDLPFELTTEEALAVAGMNVTVDAYFWVETTDLATGETAYVDALEHYNEEEEGWRKRVSSLMRDDTAYYTAWDVNPPYVAFLIAATEHLWSDPATIMPHGCTSPEDAEAHMARIKACIDKRSLSASGLYVHEHGGRIVAGSKSMHLATTVFGQVLEELFKKGPLKRQILPYYCEYGNGHADWTLPDSSPGTIVIDEEEDTPLLVAF